MEDLLDNHLHIGLSTLMKNDETFAKDLGIRLIEQLLALDIYQWENDEYLNSILS